MSRGFSGRCCNPFSIVKYLRFRAFAVLLGVVSLTSLALVFHSWSFGFNSAYKTRSPFSSTKIEDDLVRKTVKSNAKTEDVLAVKDAGNSSAACRLPIMDPFHSSVVHFMKDLGKLRCDGVSYSRFENNELRVEGEGIVSAKYRKIERTPGNDFGVVLSDPVEVQLNNASEQKGELFSYKLNFIRIAKYYAKVSFTFCTFISSFYYLTRKLK